MLIQTKCCQQLLDHLNRKEERVHSPRIKLQMAVRAVRMFEYEPRMWIFLLHFFVERIVEWVIASTSCSEYQLTNQPKQHEFWSHFRSYTLSYRLFQRFVRWLETDCLLSEVSLQIKVGERKSMMTSVSTGTQSIFTIFNFKGFDEQFIQTKKCNRILDIESQDESSYEISTLLQVSHVCSLFAVFEFNLSCPCVESDL